MLGESLKIISPTNVKKVTQTASNKPERKFSLIGASGGGGGGSSSAFSFQIDMHEYGMPVGKKASNLLHQHRIEEHVGEVNH